MAVLETVVSIVSSSSSSKPFLFSIRSKPTTLILRIRRTLSPIFSFCFALCAGGDNSRQLISVLYSVAEKETSPLDKKTEETQKSNLKRKIFVFNLPWSMTVNDISELFGQCGTVPNIKDGKNRRFAFVTMSSGEEAQAAVDKFKSFTNSTYLISLSLRIAGESEDGDAIEDNNTFQEKPKDGNTTEDNSTYDEKPAE